MTMNREEQCKTCFFNRPVWAWGEWIPNACWHGETGKDLYTINGDECSGYEDKEKQQEMEI